MTAHSYYTHPEVFAVSGLETRHIYYDDIPKIRESINLISRQLLGFEDFYRSLGGRYYSRAWLVHTDESVCPDDLRRLADALHGERPQTHRSFFHPWIDLQASIPAALDILEDKSIPLRDRAVHARKEFHNALILSNSIRRGLEKLYETIKRVEYVYEVNKRLGVGSQLPQRQRDQALWKWLRSLPETLMILHAGKKEESIIRDALEPYEEGFTTCNQRHSSTYGTTRSLTERISMINLICPLNPAIEASDQWESAAGALAGSLGRHSIG
ncbi:hypothetical protein CC78DRAFT_541357 [Lojkania enalia]|uniref:Uncharacterized protein n=1 Tax=Lojkania enalia TaxID=147567 RepID=A0A9P4KEH9_9PLEO|nr:hypothetical protein CC78DRAFT_541357 [Didymosphaeria enalia]